VGVAFRNTVLNIIDEMGDTCEKRNGKKRRPMGFLFGRTKKNRVAPDVVDKSARMVCMTH
jgi:hypothetical protein